MAGPAATLLFHNMEDGPQGRGYRGYTVIENALKADF